MGALRPILHVSDHRGLQTLHLVVPKVRLTRNFAVGLLVRESNTRLNTTQWVFTPAVGHGEPAADVITAPFWRPHPFEAARDTAVDAGDEPTPGSLRAPTLSLRLNAVIPRRCQHSHRLITGLRASVRPVERFNSGCSEEMLKKAIRGLCRALGYTGLGRLRTCGARLSGRLSAPADESLLRRFDMHSSLAPSPTNPRFLREGAPRPDVTPLTRVTSGGEYGLHLTAAAG